MKIQSAKNKGRILQQWVATRVITYFDLTKDDVRSAPMGVNGSDVQLSAEAKRRFNWATECKNKEGFKSIYDAMDQACTHVVDDQQPLVIIKSNRRKPLAILEADLFLKIISRK